MNKVYLLIILCLALIGCTSQPKEKKDKTENNTPTSTHAAEVEVGSRTMPRSGKISDLTKENYDDFIDNYWDGFDFNAGERVNEYDKDDICQALVDYILCLKPSLVGEHMRALIHRAETSRPVLDFFASVCEIVLHDPNSPYRNDEFYIPVLEVLVESPLMDEYDRIAPAYDLEMALKNRIGHKANDFVYTLSDGSQEHMYDIDTDYTLLMINNPGCPMCKQLTDDITSSPMLNEMLELDRLTILAIYPDEDLEAWREYQPYMPRKWISGYDKGMILTQRRLYNLNAIPALYLLDSQKRVLVKDGSDVGYIEYVIAETEARR